jgi:non-ribosomal peptide synthetase component F
MTLVVVPQMVRQDVTQLGNLIHEKKIDWATLPPVMAQLMDLNHLSVLKKLFVGGEAPPQDLVDRVCSVTELHNVYGPTETTVWSSFRLFQQGDIATNIGKPIPNNTLFVLDAHMAPVKMGVHGELYIGGAGVGKRILTST